MTGAYYDRDNADYQVKALKSKGFDAFILPIE
ncbi:SPOR domain-containing protein [Salinithrix halophila]|uniref:SPOR domain-containing protein n=1 Tax=Salinithrix halophila TaxID=1485204 RepID=A0ABV8JJN4_9BACL